MKNHYKIFWFVFSCISSQYRNLRSKSPYSVQTQENADQKKLRMDNFSSGDCFWISSNIFCSILGNFAINTKIALPQSCSNTELILFCCIRNRRNSVFAHFPSKVPSNSGGLCSRIFFGVVLFLLRLSWKFALCHCLRHLRCFWPLHLHIHPADTPVTLASPVDKFSFVSMLSIRVCFLGNFQRRHEITNSSYLVILLLVP